jgi:hypothetical protein
MPNFGIICFKSGMSADPNALHRSVAIVANSEGFEEEFVVEDSPIRVAYVADLLSR